MSRFRPARRRTFVPVLSLVLPVVSTVVAWRAKTEPDEDAGSVACLKSTRATEDDGWRRFAAAKRDRICGGQHLGPADRRPLNGIAARGRGRPASSAAGEA